MTTEGRLDQNGYAVTDTDEQGQSGCGTERWREVTYRQCQSPRVNPVRHPVTLRFSSGSLATNSDNVRQISHDLDMLFN